jgi:hypothetical protein
MRTMTLRQTAMLALLTRFYPLFWRYVQSTRPVDRTWLAELANLPPRERLIVPRIERYLAWAKESEQGEAS